MKNPKQARSLLEADRRGISKAVKEMREDEQRTRWSRARRDKRLEDTREWPDEEIEE